MSILRKGTCPSVHSCSLNVAWEFASSLILVQQEPAVHSCSQREEAHECFLMPSPDAINICVVYPSSNALSLDSWTYPVQEDGSSNEIQAVCSARWMTMRNDKGQPAGCGAGCCQTHWLRKQGCPLMGKDKEGKAEEPLNIWGCPRSTHPSPNVAKKQITTQTLRSQRRGLCFCRAPMIPARRPTEGAGPSQHLWPP